MDALRQRWLDGASRPIHIHKPLVQCSSNSEAPPSYQENDPYLHIIRYGPRTHVEDIFYCKGGVDAAKLLQLSRQSLLKVGCCSGGNVLLDETCVSLSLVEGLPMLTNVRHSSWDCTITKSLVRHRETFRVQVRDRVDEPFK